MKSDLPKVLHKLAGRTLLEHVYISASRLEHSQINIVYGYGGQQVPDTLSHLQANWIEQAQQLGTGHAVKQALLSDQQSGKVLILYGDIPLITYETLSTLIEISADSGFSLLTTYIDDPAGYGRIVRDEVGNLKKIVEEKDANDSQRTICEINTGIMCVEGALLHSWIQKT